ncbi:MAG: hypothetical protein PUP91_39305, partial [Rhizonema sp. PD37]|nr:hypothetical protein [Rhizonema sp. PD37]
MNKIVSPNSLYLNFIIMPASNPMITVLLLSADPKENYRLKLDQEFKRIEEVRESSKYREEFQIITCLATTYNDIIKKIIE